jgi:sugar lactone lactonase YvrE
VHRTSIAAACALLLTAASATPSASAQGITITSDRALDKLEAVAIFRDAMPTGVTVSRHGRIFVNFPRWGDKVPYTVGELKKGLTVPFPDAEINRQDDADAAHHFISVQSVVIDPDDRLWVLDTGSPLMQGTVPNGPKLVAIDLDTNKVLRTILLPPSVAGPRSYMNDVRFDLTVGASGFAYITDSSASGPNGIVVVDLATGHSWRKLDNHPSTRPDPDFIAIAEGEPMYQHQPGKPRTPFRIGADGIALSADGSRLFYCPLSGRKLYSVSTAALRNQHLTPAQVAATVRTVAPKGASDGLESDADGNVYAGDYETDSIHIIAPDGTLKLLTHDPTLLWPDTLSLADDGYLYVTSNQLERQPIFHDGSDFRVKPYLLFRVRVDARPVRLTHTPAKPAARQAIAGDGQNTKQDSKPETKPDPKPAPEGDTSQPH